MGWLSRFFGLERAPPFKGSPRSRSLNIVGESFKNTDGSSRQKEIRRCKPGDVVTLRREPENLFSADAIAVFGPRGIQVGYIGASRTAWIGAALDEGRIQSCFVERKKGGTTGSNVGLVLSIDVQPRRRKRKAD